MISFKVMVVAQGINEGDKTPCSMFVCNKDTSEIIARVPIEKVTTHIDDGIVYKVGPSELKRCMQLLIDRMCALTKQDQLKYGIDSSETIELFCIELEHKMDTLKDSIMYEWEEEINLSDE